MAEVLVRWQDKEGLSSTNRGDMIVAREDGHVWGRLEGFPDYLRVSLPGVPALRVEEIIHTEDAVNADGIAHKRRAWHINDINIPNNILRQLETAYENNETFVVENPDDALNWIEKKSTGEKKGSW